MRSHNYIERDLGLHVMPAALLERQPCFSRGRLTTRRRSTCSGSSCVQGESAAFERPGSRPATAPTVPFRSATAERAAARRQRASIGCTASAPSSPSPAPPATAARDFAATDALVSPVPNTISPRAPGISAACSPSRGSKKGVETVPIPMSINVGHLPRGIVPSPMPPFPARLPSTDGCPYSCTAGPVLPWGVQQQLLRDLQQGSPAPAEKARWGMGPSILGLQQLSASGRIASGEPRDFPPGPSSQHNPSRENSDLHVLKILDESSSSSPLFATSGSSTAVVRGPQNLESTSPNSLITAHPPVTPQALTLPGDSGPCTAYFARLPVPELFNGQRLSEIMPSAMGSGGGTSPGTGTSETATADPGSGGSVRLPNSRDTAPAVHNCELTSSAGKNPAALLPEKTLADKGRAERGEFSARQWAQTSPQRCVDGYARAGGRFLSRSGAVENRAAHTRAGENLGPRPFERVPAGHFSKPQSPRTTRVGPSVTALACSNRDLRDNRVDPGLRNLYPKTGGVPEAKTGSCRSADQSFEWMAADLGRPKPTSEWIAADLGLPKQALELMVADLGRPKQVSRPKTAPVGKCSVESNRPTQDVGCDVGCRPWQCLARETHVLMDWAGMGEDWLSSELLPFAETLYSAEPHPPRPNTGLSVSHACL
eukprot:jgi/Botrbrau1/21067/Bobra.0144s0066.1